MQLEFLYSKIHRATVTDANLNYVGSITIDETLLKQTLEDRKDEDAFCCTAVRRGDDKSIYKRFDKQTLRLVLCRKMRRTDERNGR